MFHNVMMVDKSCHLISFIMLQKISMQLLAEIYKCYGNCIQTTNLRSAKLHVITA